MARDSSDTLTASEFDALARLAACTMGAQVAQLALLDGTGLTLAASVGPLLPAKPSDNLLFRQTLAQRELLWVGDLRSDTRFADDPLAVAKAPLCFYAGLPVFDNGQLAGVVAVLDAAPRGSISAAARSQLSDLAQLAGALLERRRQAVELNRLTAPDALTRLPQRGAFEHAVHVELQHAMRTGDPFTVLALALDGLVDIGNGFGPEAVDEVLHIVAERLAPQVRLGDVLARLDGHDFGILMRHGAQDSAEVLSSRVVQAATQPIQLSSGDTVGVGLSIGMAVYSDQVGSAATLMEQALRSLQTAQQRNQRRFGYFAPMSA